MIPNRQTLHQQIRQLGYTTNSQTAEIVDLILTSHEPLPDFNALWKQEIALNDGDLIGADYKHWMLKGFNAGKLARGEDK